MSNLRDERSPSPTRRDVRRHSAARALGTGAAVLVALATCGGEGDGDVPPPNIVLVSIDSLRPDHLSAYGYPRLTSPHLEKLVREGARFDQAISTTSWTLPSHAAMFTGLYDSTHGLFDNGLSLSKNHLTLAEILSAQGYDTAGFFGGPYLHPTFGLGQGFDVYQSCMTTTPDAATGVEVREGASSNQGRSHEDITGPRTRTEVARWADTQDPDDPYFLFVHLWDVHYDFMPPAPYDTMFDPDYEGPITGALMSDAKIQREMSPRDLQHVLALYDGEIRFTDHILEGILTDLRARKLLDNTIVVVTADHGEEFFEHGQKGHNKSLWDEVLRVPLIVHYPGHIEAGLTIKHHTSLVDLLPTLASYAGFEGELAAQGRNLRPLLEGGELPEERHLAELMIDGNTMRALRSPTRKAIRPRDGTAAFLVDLQGDPREQTVYPPNSPRETERKEWGLALTQTYRRAIQFRDLLGDRTAGSVELTDGMRSQLEALGYLDGQEGQ